MFPAKIASEGSNVNNQPKVMKPGFRREEQSLEENRDLGAGERLEAEVNKKVG